MSTHARLADRIADLEAVVRSLPGPDRSDLTDFPPAVRRYVEHRRATGTVDYGWRTTLRLVEARLDAGSEVLIFTAGWVLRDGWSALGGWHARDLRDRGVRMGYIRDRVTAELAGQELLGTDERTLHRMWITDADGAQWLDVWLRQGSHDRDVLHRAGLNSAELDLLQAAAHRQTSEGIRG